MKDDYDFSKGILDPLFGQHVHYRFGGHVNKIVLGIAEAGIEIELFGHRDLTEKSSAAFLIAGLGNLDSALPDLVPLVLLGHGLVVSNFKSQIMIKALWREILQSIMA